MRCCGAVTGRLKVALDHAWALDPAQAPALQQQLAARVERSDRHAPFPGSHCLRRPRLCASAPLRSCLPYRRAVRHSCAGLRQDLADRHHARTVGDRAAPRPNSTTAARSSVLRCARRKACGRSMSPSATACRYRAAARWCRLARHFHCTAAPMRKRRNTVRADTVDLSTVQLPPPRRALAPRCSRTSARGRGVHRSTGTCRVLPAP